MSSAPFVLEKTWQPVLMELLARCSAGQPMALAVRNLIRYPPPLSSKAERSLNLSSTSSIFAKAQDGERKSGRRIWRRRKLTKKDDKLQYKMERIPFLEEQVRKIRENGKIISMDIERLMLSEENRFAFVNDVAAEAKSYVENNRDEYGSKKAILHVLSNRMNDAGFYRPEAYMETDPFKPGPLYLREEF